MVEIIKTAEGLELVSKADYDKLAAEYAAWHADPSFVAMMEALDVFFADEEVPERAMLAAYKILKPKRTAAVDAAIAEFKAQGVDELISLLDRMPLNDMSQFDVTSSVVEFAANLRAGVKP